MISTTAYTKSSLSGDGHCVEVRLLPNGKIGVRDSKDRAKPPLVFTQREWSAFTAGVRTGEFDLEREQPSTSGGAKIAIVLMWFQVRLPGWVWGAIGGVSGTAVGSYLISR